MFESLVSIGVHIGFGLFTVLAPANAPSVDPLAINCEAPAWGAQHGMVDDRYVGSMYSDCVIDASHGGDFAMLEKYAVDQATGRAQINRGPITEVFEGLPSQFFDATIVTDGKDKLTMRQDAHIASDQATKLIFATNSTDIKGEGMAAYLKKMDSRLDVVKNAKAGSFNVRIQAATEIEKPWYAPEGVFVSQIEDRLPPELVKIRDRVMAEIVTHF